jgi:hypothetical protein
MSSECFQLYYTCSDRLFAVVLPPLPFPFLPSLTVTFTKLAVILRPLYNCHFGRNPFTLKLTQEVIYVSLPSSSVI